MQNRARFYLFVRLRIKWEVVPENIPSGDKGNNPKSKPTSSLNKNREHQHHSYGAAQGPDLTQQNAEQPAQALHHPQGPEPPPHTEPARHHVRQNPPTGPREYVAQPEARRDDPRRVKIHVEPVVEVLRDYVVYRQFDSEAVPVRTAIFAHVINCANSVSM